jgi:hypothetical protein
MTREKAISHYSVVRSKLDRQQAIAKEAHPTKTKSGAKPDIAYHSEKIDIASNEKKITAREVPCHAALEGGPRAK